MGKQSIRTRLLNVYKNGIQNNNKTVAKTLYLLLSKIINFIKLCEAFEFSTYGHNNNFVLRIFFRLYDFSSELDTTLQLQKFTVYKGVSKRNLKRNVGVYAISYTSKY